MKYLRVRMKVYYGYKKPFLPSTTLAGALTQFYSINGKDKDVNFGFSDFTLLNKFPFYQNRVSLGRVYYYSFPYLQLLYFSNRKVYGEYEGCIVGDLQDAMSELKNLIFVNFSEVEDVKVEESNSSLYALAIPVIRLDDAKAFGDIVRVRFLRFHGSNELEQHQIYVLDGKDVRQTRDKVVKLVDVKLGRNPKNYNILLDFFNEIKGLDRTYMKMAHGVVVPKECLSE
ncbi:hypothetical protein [Sulfurisphaera tokodaii]|uniref:CRISPR-associated protein Cas5 n=2 Tax=Sulfurisphaera tokodaii TaxID=111955 RepID=Q96Z42_SULTO|nr:hypothetical protein [Sulfurisphaera tokodaii]BAB67084.1 hypothetical protein STK_19910 [Sulfurisphaera tokodaii str. 7]HII73392.1 hypothetical protein [Sulfurisphaera tokodaii]